MKNILISISFIAAMLLLLSIGYLIVPGIQANGSFSKEFIFNGYMALLSFMATSAVIGPLASQFVKYRLDQEWRDARINACSRLNEAIANFFSNYTGFIKSCSDHEYVIAHMLFDATIKNIEEFMRIYDDERLAFNPAMHSSCSNVRNMLMTLLTALNTTKNLTHPDTSVRLLLHRYDLDKIRALFGLPRLTSAESKTPSERDTFINKDEPIVIEEDPYFFENDRLFLDGNIEINRGTLSIVHFMGIDLSKIRSNWMQFLSSCPKHNNVDNKILENDCTTVDKQKSSHESYLKQFAKDKYLLDIILDKQNAKIT